MKRDFLIHPLLFSIYPILALFSYNVDQVHFWEVQRSLIVSLALTSVILVLLSLILRDLKRAGLVTTLIVILFFTYGHVFQLLEGKSTFGILIGRADYIAALWATVFIIGSWWIMRLLKSTAGLTKFLNTVAIFALILPGYRIITYSLKNLNVSGFSTINIESSPSSEPLSKQTQRPDIYYIILDGYGRSDVLEDIYDYDNSEFLEFLKQKDFYIAQNSHSNYAQTALSLSSSLNFEYINNLSDYVGKDSTNRDPLVELIKDSRVRTFLTKRGYQFVSFASGYSVTEIKNADLYLASSEKINSFESMLISNSAAVLWMNYITPKWYRDRILNTLQTLTDMPHIQSPKFVFAHILVPHPPFVFGPNGESIPPKSFREGNYYDGTREEYISGYRGQIIYLNRLMENVIEGILAHSEKEPIIILQGDHGPGSSLNWDSFEQVCYKERMSILNAYYLPGNGNNRLYPSITPVNTFRLILDTYFDAHEELLEDKSYFSRWYEPYDFADVTEQTNQCKLKESVIATPQ